MLAVVEPEEKQRWTAVNFTETDEQQALRKAVAELGERYGHDYTAPRARAREPLTELWNEAGKSGFLGLNLPEEYGGGGAGHVRARARRARSSTPPAAGC